MTNDKWTAEITNDPGRDHQLHVELLEGDEYRGRLYRDEQGQLQLHFQCAATTAIPVEWLLGIVSRFSEDCETRTGSQTD